MGRFQIFVEIFKHKIAFYNVRNNNKVLKRNISLTRTVLHDTGKAVNVLLFGDKIATKIHRKLAGHHLLNTKEDLWEAICDWECARFTKPEKQLTGFETWQKYYSRFPCYEMLVEANLL